MLTIIHFVSELFAYNFMRYAFAAGTMAAIVSAIIGYFVVLRAQNFAAHALSHIGFAGAAGAGLLGLSVTTGQLGMTVLAAIGMGFLGNRASKSDVAIGITLTFALGLGILFLYFYKFCRTGDDDLIRRFAGRFAGIIKIHADLFACQSGRIMCHSSSTLIQHSGTGTGRGQRRFFIGNLHVIFSFGGHCHHRSEPGRRHFISFYFINRPRRQRQLLHAHSKRRFSFIGSFGFGDCLAWHPPHLSDQLARFILD